ncbi:uncharacterized protein LOC130647580 isoform X2 [Hydractinia symbiolongicarpus]|uniref:uncharacterized protein LOC130647580 isoform X2 n=1 Tax=Hydractinia symbiolongicarpus TaxID=13093 RepID=UPI00254E7401|nr:uncharacterized protein LOC130647580 isoform X2 [Hydractinia symbiolongicarpus]
MKAKLAHIVYRVNDHAIPDVGRSYIRSFYFYLSFFRDFTSTIPHCLQAGPNLRLVRREQLVRSKWLVQSDNYPCNGEWLDPQTHMESYCQLLMDSAI